MRGLLENMKDKKMKVSIIIPVYNGAKTLEKAIKSVIVQKNSNINLVIIDGGSTDGTLDIINKYKSEIDYYISEPDKGIYDAMNKGIKKSKGDVLYFLGSDDYLCSKNVIKDIIKKFEKTGADIIYGNVNKYSKKYNYSYIINKRISLGGLKRGNKIVHQALFVKKDLMISCNLFNLNYKIASDFDFECKCFLKTKKIYYLNENISFYCADGTSSNLNKSYNETSIIIRKYFGYYFYIRYKMTRVFRLMIFNFLIKTKLIKNYYNLQK